jgi:hypothetical protein
VPQAPQRSGSPRSLFCRRPGCHTRPTGELQGHGGGIVIKYALHFKPHESASLTWHELHVRIRWSRVGEGAEAGRRASPGADEQSQAEERPRDQRRTEGHGLDGLGFRVKLRLQEWIPWKGRRSKNSLEKSKISKISTCNCYIWLRVTAIATK